MRSVVLLGPQRLEPTLVRAVDEVGVKGTIKAEPLQLINGSEKLTLRFDCKPCEMHVVGKMKKSVLQQQARDTMGGNSANASGGTATISGTRSAGDSGGKPTVDYTGTAPAAGVGSSTPQTPVARNRSNKGG